MIARLGGLVLAAYTLLALAFLTVPMVVIAAVSFGSSEFATFPPNDVTWGWYESTAGDSLWVGSFWLSLAVAVLAALGSVAVSFALAVVLVRSNIRFKRALYTLVLLPLIIPKLVTGVALYKTYAGFDNVSMIVFGHILIALPTGVIILSATIRGVDRNLERAAWTMGASRTVVLFRITLPLAAPGLVAAFLLSFLASFDEFFISLFFSAPDVVTLPIRIYTALKIQVSPSVAAVSTALIVLVAIVLTLLVAVNRLSAARGRRSDSQEGNVDLIG